MGGEDVVRGCACLCLKCEGFFFLLFFKLQSWNSKEIYAPAGKKTAPRQSQHYQFCDIHVCLNMEVRGH